jgi:hypothetical protein
MIAAIAILLLAVVACAVIGIKFGGYSDSPTDAPETEVLQQAETTTRGGGELPPKVTITDTPTSTTAPASSTTQAVTFTEFGDSIFTPDPTTPPTQPIYNPQPRPTQAPQTTQKPLPTDEPPTMTEEPTSKPSVSFIQGEMG